MIWPLHHLSQAFEFHHFRRNVNSPWSFDRLRLRNEAIRTEQYAERAMGETKWKQIGYGWFMAFRFALYSIVVFCSPF